MVGGSTIKITYKIKVQQRIEQPYLIEKRKKKQQKQMEAFYANVAA